MRILIAHNYYQQKGGEDVVFKEEAALLNEKGHTVKLLEKHNSDLKNTNLLTAAAKTVWNRSVYRETVNLLKNWKPDIVHLHNIFPIISPAIYYAAGEAGVPVVQTIHNYRLICPNAQLFRAGRICENCLGKVVPLDGIKYKCYRNSRAGTAAVVCMLSIHRLLRTWIDKVDIYIVLTDFAREKFIRAGLPEERVVVKPNFVYFVPEKSIGSGNYALYVGRLSTEKGIKTLLASWGSLGKDINLKIVGVGPLEQIVNESADKNGNIQYLGWRSNKDVYKLMDGAKVVIVPSEWYEPFGRVAIEAFARGTPVIASKYIAQIVEHGRTGLLFEPGNVSDLANKIRWIFCNPKEVSEMGKEAKAEYEAKYTAENNYEILLDIYKKAIGGSKRLPSGSK